MRPHSGHIAVLMETDALTTLPSSLAAFLYAFETCWFSCARTAAAAASGQGYNRLYYITAGQIEGDESVAKHQIPKPIRFLLDILECYLRYNIPRSAAALAYSFILSIFPILLCLNFLIGLFHLDAQTVLNSLEQFMPASALALMRDYVAYVSENQSPGLLWAGLLTILLSASAGLRVLLEAMDELYGRPKRSGVKQFLLSVILSLLFLATVYLSIVVILTGDWFLHFLEELLPQNLTALIDLPAFSALWRWVKYLILFCFVLLLVLAVYMIGTPKGLSSRASILLSALASSLALVAASGLFSLFIGMSARYALVYGSLASLIILLVWLYLCGNILLLGSVFHRVRLGFEKRPRL